MQERNCVCGGDPPGTALHWRMPGEMAVLRTQGSDKHLFTHTHARIHSNTDNETFALVCGKSPNLVIRARTLQLFKLVKLAYL